MQYLKLHFSMGGHFTIPVERIPTRRRIILFGNGITFREIRPIEL